jgi:fimbrial chaperone protein
LKGFLPAAWFLLAAAFAPFAQGGDFQVFPIKVELSAGKAVSALTVRNGGSAAVTVHIETVAWEQSDGQDSLVSSRELLVFPPIATIAPGTDQVVRVGLRRETDLHRELSYRLFIQELPPPREPGFRGLQVLLRVGIPVFVAPRDTPSSTLIWRAAQAADGALVVSARNVGNTHAQIASFQVTPGGDADPLAHQNQMAYVLNGQVRRWTFGIERKALSASSKLRLKAEVNGSVVDTDLPLGTMDP